MKSARKAAESKGGRPAFRRAWKSKLDADLGGYIYEDATESQYSFDNPENEHCARSWSRKSCGTVQLQHCQHCLIGQLADNCNAEARPRSVRLLRPALRRLLDSRDQIASAANTRYDSSATGFARYKPGCLKSGITHRISSVVTRPRPSKKLNHRAKVSRELA